MYTNGDRTNYLIIFLHSSIKSMTLIMNCTCLFPISFIQYPRHLLNTSNKQPPSMVHKNADPKWSMASNPNILSIHTISPNLGDETDLSTSLQKIKVWPKGAAKRGRELGNPTKCDSTRSKPDAYIGIVWTKHPPQWRIQCTQVFLVFTERDLPELNVVNSRLQKASKSAKSVAKTKFSICIGMQCIAQLDD